MKWVRVRDQSQHGNCQVFCRHHDDEFDLGWDLGRCDKIASEMLKRAWGAVWDKHKDNAFEDGSSGRGKAGTGGQLEVRSTLSKLSDRWGRGWVKMDWDSKCVQHMFEVIGKRCHRRRGCGRMTHWQQWAGEGISAPVSCKDVGAEPGCIY